MVFLLYTFDFQCCRDADKLCRDVLAGRMVQNMTDSEGSACQYTKDSTTIISSRHKLNYCVIGRIIMAPEITITYTLQSEDGLRGDGILNTARDSGSFNYALLCGPVNVALENFHFEDSSAHNSPAAMLHVLVSIPYSLPYFHTSDAMPICNWEDLLYRSGCKLIASLIL